jgi:deoxycytidylate deaminase
MKEKHIRKYMRLAKHIAEDENPCYSRHIGVVIVDPVATKILGTGYNGPPRDTPHTDEADYLEKFVWPQLTPAEKRIALPDFEENITNCGVNDEAYQRAFVEKYTGCKTCPRRLVGAASGQRTELCSCEHAERNAVYNASCCLQGAWMFCWCGIPCQDCTKAICQAGIKVVFTIDWGADYSYGSRYLFQRRGVEVVMHKPEYYLTGEAE